MLLPPSFTGYDGKLTAEGKILAIVADGEPCALDSLRARKALWCWIRPPSMPRWAVRLPDEGTITLGEDVFTVTNVQKDKAGKYLHHGKMTAGSLSR